MDLEQEILKEHSKKQTLKISSFIGKDPGKFEKLFYIFLNGNFRIAQRSSWVLSHCIDSHPDLIRPYLEKIIHILKNPVHDAVKRNTLRILQDLEIPKELLGETADICFKFLSSNKEPVAIKAFSMTVLYNICQKEPELKNELKILIESQLPYQSTAFKSRGSKILTRINKLAK